MSTTVTVHEAKTNLSELLRRVEAGEEIIIARGDTPVAILKDFNREEQLRREDISHRRAAGMGCLAGKISPHPASLWFEPMSDEDLAWFYGEADNPDDPLNWKR